MLVALLFDERDELKCRIAKGLMSFVGKDQPVVPVADFILEFFERIADALSLSVTAGSQFGDVARLLRALAKIMEIGGVQHLHLCSQTGKCVQRHHGGRLLPPEAQPFGRERLFQRPEALVEPGESRRCVRLQPFGLHGSAVFEPGVEVADLFGQPGGAEAGLRRFEHVRLLNQVGNLGRSPVRASIGVRLVFLFVLPGIQSVLCELRQQLAMNIQIADLARGAANLLQHPHGGGRRVADGRGWFALGKLADEAFEGGLETPGSGARVVNGVDVGIGGAFRQIFSQRGSQPTYVFEVVHRNQAVPSRGAH